MKNLLNLLVPVLLLLCHWNVALAQCDQPAENCYETVCLFSKTELEAGPWNSGGFLPDPMPPGGFCSMIQNDQWFAFVADSVFVQLSITTSDCETGNGLQLAVYRNCDTLPIACHGGCAGCGTETFTLNLNTEPGAIYYLLVDGFAGDVCDFGISTKGVSNNPPALEVGLVEGKVLWDINQDCLPDGGDLPVAGVVVRFEGNKKLVRPSKTDGSFKFFYFDSGDVTVSIDDIPGHYWVPCESSYVVRPSSFPDTTQVNFLLTPFVSCAYMQVDLGLPPFGRPCEPTGAAVQYCNTGTVAAENAYIEVTVPQGLTVDSTSLPIAAQYGDTLRFDVGTVQPFEYKTFYIYLKMGCPEEIQLGQTLCLSAHIYPDTICPAWTLAHIDISAKCIGDTTVRFKLHNTGSMASSMGLEYIIIEDEVVLHAAPYNLAPGDSMIIEKPAKGHTWRMEAEQEPGHPGRSMPAAAIEGCGGLVSVGLINAFPQDDADDFVDIECLTVVGSYDPNLKAASPSGVSSSHLIRPNTPIEYIIHFQNTGTDTAFTVRLLDTLPNTLDVKTFRPGTSSHPCTWQFLDERILEVLFSPIALPDSNANERASHGWFEFSMEQKNDLPNGTRIENRAAIYFDFNPPIITDEAWHTVGKLSVSIQEPKAGEPSLWRVLGNPARESCTFQALKTISEQSRFQLTDAQGREVHAAEFSGQQYSFERGGLAAGLYFFNITTARDGVVTGKIMLHD